jgi:hypothetical protein
MLLMVVSVSAGEQREKERDCETNCVLLLLQLIERLADRWKERKIADYFLGGAA